MIILHYFPNTNEWATLIKDEFNIVDCTEINTILSDALESGDIVYINAINLFKTNIVKAINDKGFDLVYRMKYEDKLKDKEASYIINANGTVLNFELHDKKTTFVYGTTNIIKSPDTDIAIYGDGDSFEEQVVRGIFSIISILNDITRAKKKIPFTIAGYSNKSYKKTGGSRLLGNCAEDWLDDDHIHNTEDYIRPSYHGGYVNVFGNTHKYNYLAYGKGIILDINSLYPYVMKYKPMPYGKATLVKGEPDESVLKSCEKGRLYIFININVAFKLKKDGLACIRINNNDPSFLHTTSYLKDSRDINMITGRPVGKPKKINLCLTYTDFMLLKENYDIIDIDYVDYIYYKTTTHYFEQFIDTLYPKKQQSEGATRLAYKLLLNALSGKMASLPFYDNQKIVKLSDEKFVFEKQKGSKHDGMVSHINVGSAITAYARQIIIADIKANRDRILYSDTDCLQLKGTEIPEDMAISDQLGAYKIEHEFDNIVYYGKKSYAFIEDGKIKLVLAGTKYDDRQWLIRKHDDFTKGTFNKYDDLYIGNTATYNNEDRLTEQFALEKNWFESLKSQFPQFSDPVYRKVISEAKLKTEYIVKVNNREYKYYGSHIVIMLDKLEKLMNQNVDELVATDKKAWEYCRDELNKVLCLDDYSFLKALSSTSIFHTSIEPDKPFSAKLRADFAKVTSINNEL